MSTMTKSITCDALSQSCWANGEKQNYEINYDYFFSADAKARTPNYLRRMADKAFNMGYKIFRFSNGAPNSQSFPYEEISVKLKNGETFKIEGGCLAEGLNYLKTNGYPPLLNLLKDFQDRFHGKQDWKKKDLTTTAGGQAGLDQLIKLSVSPGDPVLVQSPCYTGLLSILDPLNVEILEVDNGSNGICSIKLEKMLNDRREKNLPMPKIFYICPTGNNPTGDTTSTKTKKEIYEIARKYNFLILEDDPYYLLTYENERSTSFLRLDTDNRVVRFDSFSKTIGAGYRIGYVTAAQEIVNKLNLIKESSSYCSPICQVIVHETLQKMGFDGFLDHIAVIRDFYLKNYHAILASLDKHLKDVATWKPPQAALFVWITIKNVDHIPQSFIDKCVENSVLIIPGFAFYATERRSPCIRLSFSMVNEDEIDEGVQILARLIKEELLTRAR